MRHFFLSILIVFLASCSSHRLPPFATSSRWTLDGSTTSSATRDMAINFGGENSSLLTNMSDGDYELHFITGTEQFDAEYNDFCKNYITSAIKQIPLKIDSMEFVLADQYIVFTPSIANWWAPDLARLDDGTELVAEANPRPSDVQPHNEIWRNFVFDNKRHRILVVDRLVKDGKHLAIAYIVQSEDKHVPFSSILHYDVTLRRNIQPAGEYMRGLLDITIAASHSHAKRLNYGDCIHAADSCFMASDFLGALRQFDAAFATRNENIPGSHIYNAACAASLAGMNDRAFALLNARLGQEPNWYVDDPAADRDLAGLHDDARWQAVADTLIARRDRIEANYDKPLRARLQDIGQSDQAIRHEFLKVYRTSPRNQTLIDSLTLEMQRVDSINQAAICQILDTRGFVGSDRVGNACTVFWLVIQHAPLALQKKYFPHFKLAAQRGDLAWGEVAMMDDRIAMFEGRPQKYGSQIVDGKLYPLLDPNKVDSWRQEVGMQPLADYLRMMGASR
ncbi:MAG: tetratricopeptide repeat protein [Muribaculaceae bacterium]|nr:tetratricopeptide repeat protein [Muribaculaceae bacterium]